MTSIPARTMHSAKSRRAGLMAVLLVSGCATPHTPQQIAAMDTRQLCSSFYNVRTDEAKASYFRSEMQSRGLVKPEDWSAIDKGSIRVGMSVCALYASWGPPDRENRTTTAAGVSIQHVYSGYSGRYIRTKSNYAYTRNGVITAIQN